MSDSDDDVIFIGKQSGEQVNFATIHENDEVAEIINKYRPNIIKQKSFVQHNSKCSEESAKTNSLPSNETIVEKYDLINKDCSSSSNLEQKYKQQNRKRYALQSSDENEENISSNKKSRDNEDIIKKLTAKYNIDCKSASTSGINKPISKPKQKKMRKHQIEHNTSLHENNELTDFLSKYNLDKIKLNTLIQQYLKISRQSTNTICLSSDEKIAEKDDLINKDCLKTSSSSSKLEQEYQQENKKRYSDQYLDEDDACISPSKQLKDDENINKVLSNNSGESAGTSGINKPTSKTKENKMEKDQIKQQKQMEREQKKQEEQKNKEIKKILSIQHKNLKPDQCLKFITADINYKLESEKYFNEIVKAINDLGASYKITKKTVPYTISWKRSNQTHLMAENGELAIDTKIEDTNDFLIILNWQKVVEEISNDNLVPFITNIQSTHKNHRIYLGIYGMNNYFKYWKNLKNCEHKATVVKSVANQNKYDKIYKQHPHISKSQLDTSLTELQILFSCCSRLVETPEDIGLLVGNFTKSIAQAPYKKEKQEKYQQHEKYLVGDNKDCVRVDKNGNGLKRLWKQQLTNFPLASLETAEAVMSQYPSAHKLFKAYEDKENDEFLLQNIAVRRAAGPFSSIRKLGPEFSKKVHTYCTSLNPKTLL